MILIASEATGATALFTMPSNPNQPGTWVSGPNFPTQGGAQLIGKDAPGCLLPYGKVLCAVSPAGPCAAENGGYCLPTSLKLTQRMEPQHKF